MTFKHKITFYLAAILLVIAVVIGSSYAFYTSTHKSNNTIKTVQGKNTPNTALDLFKTDAVKSGLVDGIENFISDKDVIFSGKGYISELVEENSVRYAAGFGSLKSDSNQGVVIVKVFKKESNSTITTATNKYLSPSKHGAITAINVNGFTIGISTKDGKEGIFNIFDGFRSFPK